MNTINVVRPYVSLKNNSQTSAPQASQTSQTPSFKGTIGDRVVKQLAAKEAVTIAGIVGLAAGMIGLNKDKVTDITESFVDRIKGLQNENEVLSQQIQKQKIDATKSKEDFVEREKNLRNSFSLMLQNKNSELAQKDAKIAELQKYESMSKVKSVEEIDAIMPEEFLEILKEAKEAESKAENSLLNYMFNGVGQEEFLAQLERGNKILKARQNGITNIPEMQKAYEDLNLPLGIDPVYSVYRIAEKALKRNESGAQINYPPVKKVVADNLNALTQPLQKEGFHYNNVQDMLKGVADFYTQLDLQKNDLIRNKGYEFTGRFDHDNGRPYYSFFDNRNNVKFDIYLEDLANQSLGYARTTLADGTTRSFAPESHWS